MCGLSSELAPNRLALATKQPWGQKPPPEQLAAWRLKKGGRLLGRHSSPAVISSSLIDSIYRLYYLLLLLPPIWPTKCFVNQSLNCQRVATLENYDVASHNPYRKCWPSPLSSCGYIVEQQIGSCKHRYVGGPPVWNLQYCSWSVLSQRLDPRQVRRWSTKYVNGCPLSSAGGLIMRKLVDRHVVSGTLAWTDTLPSTTC